MFQSLSPASKKHVTAPTQTGKELSEETKKFVKEFYLSDLNSDVMPGKKDVLSVKLDGLKTKQRKRLLLDEMDNLHQMFNEQYLEHKVGCTKFFELCPLWFIPVPKQYQEICKCKYHKNIDVICEALFNRTQFQRLLIHFKDVSNADNI